MRKYFVLLTAAAILTGCGEVGDTMLKKQENVEHHEGDGHDHSGEAGHEGHDHAHEAGHDHGEHHDLGTTTTAGISYQVLQLGAPAGGEQAVEIVLGTDSAKPAALRAWVGGESGEGSMKTKADGTGPKYEMHLEVPEPLAADARLWVEVEGVAGERGVAGFELKR
jgi:hypothetical protein